MIKKKYILHIIDQQIEQHFVQYSEILSNTLPFYATQIVNPLHTSLKNWFNFNNIIRISIWEPNLKDPPNIWRIRDPPLFSKDSRSARKTVRISNTATGYANKKDMIEILERRKAFVSLLDDKILFFAKRKSIEWITKSV